MKILKIEGGKGFYLDVKANNRWLEVDQIDKNALMAMLDLYIGEVDIEMDEFDAQKIPNQAHQIIYKSIFEKLSDLKDNKKKFKDEADRTYLEQIRKYQK